ncbi:MAG: hypothetical protein GIS02_03965 [Methanosarcinales archaeon]|uniref:Uncharacterized protein n=1 Tax=Candidatus Ethanoperedens thermophilum TaxID=2766897 RepID=A0A848D9Z6_9EURY|nr:hypothetical protein [Candidatus Ethanoperedens thermophilum]
MTDEKQTKGVDWDVWVTHIIAFIFIGVCLSLLIVAVVFMDNVEMVKIVMGFSSSMLGIILGYYFNRERLVEESRGRRDVSARYEDIRTLFFELQDKDKKYERDIKELKEEIKKEQEEN